MSENEKNNTEELIDDESCKSNCDCGCNDENGNDDNNMKEVNNLKCEIEKKNEEICSLKDLMIRRQADFDNYRKRVIKNEDQNKKMAVVDVIKDILKINDDVLRAAESAGSMSEIASIEDVKKSFVDGVLLISKNIESILKKYNISEVDSEGAAFNPNIHEAVDIELSDNVTIDTVAKVYQKGYTLDEFVVRNARVKVSKPKPSQNDKTEEVVNTD